MGLEQFAKLFFQYQKNNEIVDEEVFFVKVI